VSLLLGVSCLIALILPGCGGDRIIAHAEAWPEASMLFRRDPRWVGGDGAYSVLLGGDRVLWLFGDSFIARGDKRQADDSVFIRNSVAIQTGLDPTRAFISFYWSNAGGGPQSFLPEADNGDFFWPGHGAVIDGVLVLFYGRLSREDKPLQEGLEPWTALLVDNPGDAPSEWTLRPALQPPSFGIDMGAAVLVEGDSVLVYGKRGDDHDAYLARWPRADVRIGDLRRPSWWCGDERGWVDSAQGMPEPAVVIDEPAPELSIHYDARAGKYLQFETTGYGATDLGVRWSPRPEGPWSPVETFFRPPESLDVKPFVYAGKAHPELYGADIVLTYVPSHFPEDNINNPDYYYPYFARATLEPP
jgi:hypothetical protein